MGFFAALFGGHAKAMPVVAAGLPIQSSSQGLPIPLVFGTNKIAPNLIWYGDFLATAQQSSGGGGGGKGGVGGGGGGKGGGGSVQYTYQAAFQFGLCDGPILGIRNVYVSKQVTTLAALGYTTFLGGYSQTAWGYLTSNHAGQDLNYRGLAHIDNPAYQMGNSPQIPNHNVEVQARYSNATTTPGDDADPSQVVNFLMTDAKSGAGYPSGKLNSLSVFQAYCIANGLWISPVYISQTPCASMIKELMDALNSAPVFSSGMLSIIPYGDKTITANGYTYTAPTTAQYDISDDDFTPLAGNDPVYLDRADNADAYNSFQLECVDRNNQYNPAVVSAKDQALIDTYGLREQTTSAHYFADLNAGRTSAQLQLQRQSKRNKYRFTLDHRYVFLDPMDLITLTCHREDGTLWLDHLFVRILTIKEDESGNFAMVAEEYPAGVASAPLYTYQAGNGYAVDYNSTPGNANTPVIFEPPTQVSRTGGLEVDIAASGGANWGGCEVWIGADADSYKFALRITGKSRQGVLSGSLASGVDPDVTNTLHVDLTQSSGDMNSGTMDDADNNHTLCYVDGEYISYETATLTGANQYDLTYLRRGQFGSTIASHANGSQFARMDGGISAYTYDKSKVGQKIYIKLISFNQFGGGLQSLADVMAYTHVLTGPPTLGVIENFRVAMQGNILVCRWQDLVYEGGLKGYDIAFGLPGTSWEEKTFLTEALRGTEMTNASLPAGNWDVSIRARDIAGNGGPISTANVTVTNPNPIISNVGDAPDWLGTLTNFFKHYTGVLTPLSTKTVDQYNPISAPSAPTLSQVAGGALTLGTVYAKVTYVDASGESLASTQSSLLILPSQLPVVTSPGTSGLATAYNVYLSTSSGAETLQNAAPIPLGASFTLPASGLVSGAAVPAHNSTGWQVFDLFVPDPVTSASYEPATVDVGYDSSIRVYSLINYGLGFSDTGTPNIGFEIDTWLTAEIDPGTFTPWVIGFINMRYIRSKMVYSAITQASAAYVSNYTVILDAPLNVENAIATIAPGGTVVTFPVAFHTAPFIQVTVISGTALYAEATSITATTAQINVYDSTGSDVGGVVNYSATGQ